MDGKIKQFVHCVRARLREQYVIDNLIRYVGIGMAIAVLIVLIALFVPFYYAIVLATIVLLFSFIMGIIWGVKRTPSPMQAALMADAKGHREKISTALYLAGKEDAFSQLQKRDALRIVEQFQIRKEFPIRLEWKQVGVVAILAVVFVVSSLLDTPAKQEAYVRHDVKQEAKEEIERLEKLEKSLEKNPELDQAEVAEIEKQIENAKKELKEAESYDELNKACERINKKLEMASKEVKNQTLGEMLQQAAKEGEELEKEKEQELAKEAEEALEKAANGSDKDKEDAYQKLKKLASATGDEQLAQAAEAYRESAYSNDDYANAVKSLNQTLQNMENSQYAQNTNQNNSGQNNQNNSNNSTQSGNENQGNNGQGDGNQGNNGGENGSGNGQGNGNTGNGTGPGWNYGGREGQEGARKTNEDITIPDGENGNDENLTGKTNGNDSSTKSKSNQAKTWSGNKVSYDEVSGKYKDEAYKKVNGSNYPSKMKERIRNYFDGLN